MICTVEYLNDHRPNLINYLHKSSMPTADNKSLQSLIDALRIPPDFARYENLEPAALSSLDEWKCNTSNVLSEIRNLLLRTQDEGIQDNEGTPPLKELGDIIFAVTPFTAVKFERNDGEYPWATLSSAEVAQGTHRHFCRLNFQIFTDYPTYRYSLHHSAIHTPNRKPSGPNPNAQH